MKIKLIICTLLFCCLGIAQEPISHTAIPNGGNVEGNVTPNDDGNWTMLVMFSCFKSDTHATTEFDLIPGHTYFFSVKDMGIAKSVKINKTMSQ